MNRSEWDSIVELKCEDVFLVGPVLSISLNRNRKTGFATLAFRTFAFKSIRAVTAVYIQTVQTFQNPNPGVPVGSALISQPEDLLAVSVAVAELFHAANDNNRVEEDASFDFPGDMRGTALTEAAAAEEVDEGERRIHGKRGLRVEGSIIPASWEGESAGGRC